MLIDQWLQPAATLTGLIYIVLLIRERILCWPFGILGSLLSVALFLDTRLYSEAILYVFYALMGCWGWWQWQRRQAQDGNPITRWNWRTHRIAIVITSMAAVALGLAMQTFSDAQRPMFDAFTTAFSFFATYLEINKVLEGWLYWLLINAASIWLYHDRNLDLYALLIVVYTALSLVGFLRWRETYRQQGEQQLA